MGKTSKYGKIMTHQWFIALYKAMV